MNPYFFNVNQEERNNILDKHKTAYDGYAVRQNTSNQQPIYVQDLANDKNGVTVNSKGEVSTYNNKVYMKESKNICSECGLYENVCECGIKENLHKETGKFPKHQSFDYVEEENDSEFENDKALAVDDITGDSDLGLAMMDTDSEMEEGLFDFFDDEYEDFNDYLNSDDDESFAPLKNIKGERDTAFSRMKRGKGDIEDIDFEDMDDDIKESFMSQKKEITEMFNRFKKYN